MNKTRFAILGILLERPSTGYEIKALMKRSTVYFWRESDSTIYPMLKVLAKEGKAVAEIAYVGKKKKEVFSITDSGRAELEEWLASPTASETPRNEFLLKLFFTTDAAEMNRLFKERLETLEGLYQEYKKIEQRLEGLPHYSYKEARLESLRYGLAHLKFEIEWIKNK